MAEDRWRGRTLLIVLLMAAVALAFPVMAQGETITPSQDEILTWTLPPASNETPEVTPEVTTEVTTEATTEATTEETLEVTTEVTTEETLEVTPEETTEATPEATLDETAKQVVPGDTIQVTDEAQVYDLSALRNESASTTAGESAQIIELQAYVDDDLDSGDLTNTVSLGSPDTGVELDASDFNGVYGTYYPYDGEAVIDKSITVKSASGAAVRTPSADVEAENTSTAGSIVTSNDTVNETVTGTDPPTTTETDEVTVEESSTADMPTFTPMSVAEVNPDQTQTTPISLSGAVASTLVAAVLFFTMRRK